MATTEDKDFIEKQRSKVTSKKTKIGSKVVSKGATSLKTKTARPGKSGVVAKKRAVVLGKAGTNGRKKGEVEWCVMGGGGGGLL